MPTAKTFDLAKLIKDLPPGLDRGILQVLSHRIGRDQAIGRDHLVAAVNSLGYPAGDRQIRAQINLLRKAGHPICSTGGLDGGYWIAADWQELDNYLDQEVRARLADLREQEQALVQAGRDRWGQARQMGLF